LPVYIKVHGGGERHCKGSNGIGKGFIASRVKRKRRRRRVGGGGGLLYSSFVRPKMIILYNIYFISSANFYAQLNADKELKRVHSLKLPLNIIYMYVNFKSRDSAVGIATGYGLDD
jgi:hypothetical protein